MGLIVLFHFTGFWGNLATVVPVDSGVGDHGFNCRSQSSTTISSVNNGNKNKPKRKYFYKDEK